MSRRVTIEREEHYLRQISAPVDLEKDNYQEWIKELRSFCLENSVFALAGVQIGIPKRIIYFKNTTEDMEKNKDKTTSENVIMINPEILDKKGETYFWEGCASCIERKNDEIIYTIGYVKRPYEIKVSYIDGNGKKKIKSLTGFKATVFSHEYDHLNGILHPDIAEKIKKRKLRRNEIFKREGTL